MAYEPANGASAGRTVETSGGSGAANEDVDAAGNAGEGAAAADGGAARIADGDTAAADGGAARIADGDTAAADGGAARTGGTGGIKRGRSAGDAAVLAGYVLGAGCLAVSLFTAPPPWVRPFELAGLTGTQLLFIAVGLAAAALDAYKDRTG
jgi:hypothetical protein